MSLSQSAKDILVVALANRKAAEEVAAAIDAGANASAPVAASVAPVASANADAVFDAAEQALLNECKAQINAVIAALKASGQMAP